MNEDQRVRVSLELGKRWVFATALDWPGWCRRGKGEQAALDTLLDYAGRYAAVAGREFEPGEIQVVGPVTGTLRLACPRPRMGDRGQEHVMLSRLPGQRSSCASSVFVGGHQDPGSMVGGLANLLPSGCRMGVGDRICVIIQGFWSLTCDDAEVTSATVRR